jgi:hypothetical protein
VIKEIIITLKVAIEWTQLDYCVKLMRFFLFFLARAARRTLAGSFFVRPRWAIWLTSGVHAAPQQIVLSALRRQSSFLPRLVRRAPLLIGGSLST